jgi:RNA polymerase sigma-70 factor (ECF subfamily)
MNDNIHAPSPAGSRGADLERQDHSPSGSPAATAAVPSEAELIRQLRQGEPEAGRQFVRAYYAGVYRYLLYLSRSRDNAEDLTQETFLQAWRRLDTFAGRAPLSLWLHRIAHREFLQSLRSQRVEASLEVVAEPAATRKVAPTEEMELWDAIRKLPGNEREVVVLHYLHGYDCAEIAEIVRAHVSTVKYRLTLARAHLQRELGEGDLGYLNGQGGTMRRWAWLPLEALTALEARLPFRGRAEERGETVMSDTARNGMSRRKLLEAAGTAAAATLSGGVEAAAARNDADIVDDRLTRKVTLAVKATALADLCSQLQAETRIRLSAGPSVADEKVTVFCEKLPLREVMRQLSRPFGYTWLRSGTPGQYRYELVQDLRSQLLEEELRNRDRNAALLALEREIDRYRPYLDLSPDEALARAKSAAPEEKTLLERFADLSWGPVQMYFRLSPNDLAAIRARQWLVFSAEPRPEERPLPPDLARGVLQSLREERVIRRDDGFSVTTDTTDPRGAPLTAVPEARAQVKLSVQQSELGQFTLEGLAGRFIKYGERRDAGGFSSHGPLATGKSREVVALENERVNAKMAHDPALQTHVTVETDGSRKSEIGSSAKTTAAETDARAIASKVTSADVLEALHRATGMPIIADFYTRLYLPEMMSVRDRPLFQALNQLSDAMHFRWNREEPWLQFRSASFYDDRPKEVPNRLLHRWAESRRQHEALSLDDIVEIAGLSDPQLDGGDMAEGAKALWGLEEWDLARYRAQRPHLRYLATFTPEQRQAMMGAAGLPFARMSLPQQQQFIALGVSAEDAPLQSFDELVGAVLRVEYTVPGWFQWGDPNQMNLTRWVVPLEPIPNGARLLRPPVVERTRAAALAVVRRVDPHLREALAREWTRQDPRAAAVPPADEAQIYPTELSLTIVYIPGRSNRRSPYVWVRGSNVTFY